MGNVLHKNSSYLIAHGDDELPPAEHDRLDRLLARRQAGEPLAYLTGWCGFWTLDLTVTPDVLVPRPDSETLVSSVLNELPSATSYRIADLGTGSGALALALASERRHWQLVGTEASDPALAVAEANRQRLGLDNAMFCTGEWFAALGNERYDAIITNPPYVATDDPNLAADVHRFEPNAALFAGSDGLDALRTIIDGAHRHLTTGGRLFVEHGFDQAVAVGELMTRAGFEHVTRVADLAGHPRVTFGLLAH